ncbi:MAG: hypothetical protein KGK07_17020 [Chloroflexota bacterium]|nr:hypothetical protein [Chloroflexota bacterium]
MNYQQLHLYDVPGPPTDIAVSANEIFVAEVYAGARPADVTASILKAALRVGATLAEVPGSRVGPGAGIYGIAIHDNAVYMSEAASGTRAASGIFRVATPPMAIVGGSTASGGSAGNGDGGPALSAVLQGPQGFAFDSSGDLFIAEAGDSRIRLVRDGTISTYAGTGACTGPTPPNGPAQTTAVCNPSLVAIGRDGAVYAAQRDELAWIVRIMRDTVTAISNDFPVTGLAIDTDGSLLAADGREGRIVRIATTGPASASVVASGLGSVRGLAVGGDGSIYFASRTQSTSAIWGLYQLRRMP